MSSQNWILVTGGTGFVGFALAKRLISLGYSVRIITRRKKYDNTFKNFLNETAKNKLQVIVGDIRKASGIKQAFKGVEYVFHVAALVNSVLPHNEFEAANVSATKNICELCLAFGINKLIYISTSDVFGLPGKDTIITELLPYKNWGEPYPDTKIKASKLVKDFQKKGLMTTIFYPGWVYGPGDKAFMPSILKQLRSGLMPIWDGGKFKISLVFIDDLIEAIIMALLKEESANEDFLILDDSSQTNLEDICKQLGLLFNVRFKIIYLPYWFAYTIAWTSQKLFIIKLIAKPIMSTTDVKSFGNAFKFSTNKAKKLLDWSIKKDFKAGLAEWKSWYEE
jgi:nucleoside-diphosphate-sugar epimerase